MPLLDNFTGVILPVFYVKDTLTSLHFYCAICGFTLNSFYDQETGEVVKHWHKAEPPNYISMAAADQEFALHLNKGQFPVIGGTLHYFEVKDIDSQRQAILDRGGTPSEIEDLPWMRLFSMIDLDGHKLFFQTPNPGWPKNA